MSLTRRRFLQGAAVLSAAGFAPRFLTGATAAPLYAIDGFTDGRILVVVQLGGGNDGLNTVVPISNDDYHRARPSLRLRDADVLRINSDTALHGSMTGLMDLYEGGKLAIVQGVGYPNPDRSHFRSMEIWHTASGSDAYWGDGWIGRYFDNTCSGAARPHAGLAVDQERPQAFDGARGFGIATENPEQFGWKPGPGPDSLEAFSALNAPRPGANSAIDFLRHTATLAMESSDEVRKAAKKAKISAPLRDRRTLNQLDVVAGLIRGGLQTRIYYVSTGGFDTHANQAGQHQRLLKNFSDALARFQNQLERDGVADQVVTLVFSEFGRRVFENGSGGTDHGTAAPVFLMGNAVRPGIHGAAPDLARLDHGDLLYATDFRAVYATLLEKWFGTDPKAILKARFDCLDLLA